MKVVAKSDSCCADGPPENHFRHMSSFSMRVIKNQPNSSCQLFEETRQHFCIFFVVMQELTDKSHKKELLRSFQIKMRYRERKFCVAYIVDAHCAFDSWERNNVVSYRGQFLSLVKCLSLNKKDGLYI